MRVQLSALKFRVMKTSRLRGRALAEQRGRYVQRWRARDRGIGRLYSYTCSIGRGGDGGVVQRA